MTTTTTNNAVNGHTLDSKADEDNILVMKVVHNQPFVHGRHKAGRWGRPVVDSEGHFYKSIKALSEALKVDPSYAKRIVEKKLSHKGKQYSYASVEQTRKHVSIQAAARKNKRRTAAHAAMAARTRATSKLMPVNIEPAASTSKAEMVFIGIQWPDGRVTVRLASGGEWQMMRPSRSELPVEVLANCRWR